MIKPIVKTLFQSAIALAVAVIVVRFATEWL